MGGKDGKGKRDDSLTVFVGGLPFSADEETLKKDFGECGEIDRFNMPMNDEGRPKGIAFITYKSEEGVTKALEFNETDYGGRTIKVNKAGDRPAKGKEGKKGGLSSEKKAAKDGAMVEGTGKKQTFDDSEEEEAPPAKKAKKAPKEDEEEEAAEPPAKKAKKAKKAKPPVDSDDDE